MKSTLSILALAAGVVADGFRDAGSFSCPGNTNNQCNTQQQSGYDFGSAPLNQPGFSYGGMFFDKWTCESGGNSKRFDRRGSGKQITGSCSSDKDQCPSFGCESGGGIDSFSISIIEVFVEFDCDLEFHYSMPDGSDCKQRSPCSSKGSSISNTQCGGAKNVTVVYPSQSGKPKPSCSVTIPSVSFSCHSTTTQPGSHSTSSPGAHTTTTSSAAGRTTTSSTQAAQTTTTTTSSTQAVQTTTSSTTSSAAGQSSQQSSTPSSTPSSSPIITTSVSLSTSTVLTTITSTITSCAASVTNCPAESRSVTTTTVVIAVSTTVCPVTLTQTQSVAPTSTSSPAVVVSSSMSSPQAVTTTTTSSSPVGTLPCPSVVPSCLNTWLFSLSCTDNTDTGCYCPNTIFVENIFSCIYAHGETDEIISEAVIFFQGLCAPYVGGNPGIATGAATVTTYLTVTPTPQAGATYTTITVEATTVVPCTNEAGSTIPSSSQTATVTATLTVPQVGFTTTAGSVGVVPVTAESTQAAAAAASTTLTTYAPAGTGSSNPTASSSSPLVTVNAAGRVSTSFGLAGLAVMGLVAAL